MSEKTCSVEGCGRKHLAKGLCDTHYHRMWLERCREQGKVRRKWKEVSPERYAEVTATNNRMAISECSDHYVRQKLIRKGFPKESITPELIELQRAIIKNKRQVKKGQTE